MFGRFRTRLLIAPLIARRSVHTSAAQWHGGGGGCGSPKCGSAAPAPPPKKVPFVSTKKYDYDLAVIGAGSGGVAASRRAAKYGARVALFDAGRLGGTCVNVGCVPKKLYVYATSYATEALLAPGYGYKHGAANAFDWAAVVANKDKEIERLNGVYARMLTNSGVQSVRENVTIVNPHTLRSLAPDAAKPTITAERILIATGSTPYKPSSVEGIEHAISSNEMFELKTLPKSIAIVGGGYIGTEFAYIMRSAGVKQVSQIVRSSSILSGGFDIDLCTDLMVHAQARGINLMLNTDVIRIKKRTDGRLDIVLKDATNAAAGEQSLTVDTVLYAAGRRPNTSSLGLSGVGVKTDPKAGAISVNEWSQTSVPSIYAIGDVTDRVNLTPVAIAEGRAFAETTYNSNPMTMKYDLIPRAVFSQPEIASVGLTEQAARRQHSGDIDIYRTRFRPMRYGMDRKLPAAAVEQSMMKLIVQRSTDRVLGAHMFGAGAGEHIQCLAVALTAGAKKSDFDRTTALHPTSAEEWVLLNEKRWAAAVAAMQALYCVKGEIHNVLTALRLHAPSKAGDRRHTETPLMRGLKELHDSLSLVSDLRHLDAAAVVQPFLAVIISDATDVHTTSIALQAVHKFLMYGHISHDSPHVADAVSNIAYYVSHCQFDVKRKEDAEVVEMRILEVLLECLRCGAGSVLTNEAVCGMVTECFNVRTKKGVTKLLKQYAEGVIMQMVIVIFSTLSAHQSSADGGAAGAAEDSKSNTSSTPTPRRSGHHRSSNGSDSAIMNQRSTYGHQSNGSFAVTTNSATAQRADAKSLAPLPVASASPRSATASGGAVSPGAGGDSEPYGLPALHRVFRFLVSLINPFDKRHEEDIRELGLRLIRTVFETAGHHLAKHTVLVSVIQDDLCKYLLQNANSRNPYTLSLTLRIVFDLFNTAKQHLKVQLEVFFTSLHLRMLESESSTFEQKELVLESLVEFCNEPSLIVGLYRNYDCEMNQSDLFEELCKFLLKSASPHGAVSATSGSTAGSGSSGSGSSSGSSGGSGAIAKDGGRAAVLHMMSLEGILAVLESISRRFCSGTARDGRESPALGIDIEASDDDRSLRAAGAASASGTDDEAAATLAKNRHDKRRLNLALTNFANEGHKSFKFLQGLKFLPDPITPESVAQFFRTTPGLSKDRMGEYLGEEHKFNQLVLDEFAKTFDFRTAPQHAASSTLMIVKMQAEGRDMPPLPPAPAGAAAAATPAPAPAATNTTGATATATSAASPSPMPASLIPARGIDDALRMFLDAFMLPGEAQKIARIMERFARQYFAQCPGPLANEDACYVFAYSIIMLNTDAHKPQIVKKMTRAEFVKMTRGINGGKDLPYVYLSSVYESITTNEIKLSVKGDVRQSAAALAAAAAAAEGGAGDGSMEQERWNSMLKGQSGGGTFQTSAPRSTGREMFALLWDSALDIFISYLEKPSVADHPKVLHKIVTGLQTYARICTVYGLNDRFNSLIIGLSKLVCRLLEETYSMPHGFRPIAEFGADRRATRLVSVLFSLCLEHGDAIHEGWTNVLHVILWLRQLELLPRELSELDDFRDSGGKPLESLRPPPEAAEPVPKKPESSGGGYGFLSSALSVFLPSISVDDDVSTSASSASAAHGGVLQSISSNGISIGPGIGNSDIGDGSGGAGVGLNGISEEEQCTKAARECIAGCQISELFSSCSKYLSPAPLTFLMRALMLVSSFGATRTPAAVVDVFHRRVINEEAAVFCLERVAAIIEKRLQKHRIGSSNHSSSANLLAAANAAPAGASDSKSGGGRAITNGTTALVRVGSGSNKSGAAAANAPAAGVTPASSADDRGLAFWSQFETHFESALKNSKSQPTFYMERVVVNLLRFAARPDHSEKTTPHLIRLLSVLSSLPAPVLAAFGQRITSGVHIFIETHAEHIREPLSWQVVMRVLLHFVHHRRAAPQAFASLVYLLDHHINFGNYSSVLSALLAFTTPTTEKGDWTPVRAADVLQAMLKLHTKLETLTLSPADTDGVELKSGPAKGTVPDPFQEKEWAAVREFERDKESRRRRMELWLNSLQAFCVLCSDRRADVRMRAAEMLQNAMLRSGVQMKSAGAWKICFEKLLLPLLQSVFTLTSQPTDEKAKSPGAKPSPAATAALTASDAERLSDIRLKVSSVVFQAFLHNLELLSVLPDFNSFWLKFIGSLERVLKVTAPEASAAAASAAAASGRPNAMASVALHITESVKNVMLVMHASGVFAEATKRSGQDLLALTFAVLDTFRPDLRQQLTAAFAPPVPRAHQPQPQPQAQAQAQSAPQPAVAAPQSSAAAAVKPPAVATPITNATPAVVPTATTAPTTRPQLQSTAVASYPHQPQQPPQQPPYPILGGYPPIGTAAATPNGAGSAFAMRPFQSQLPPFAGGIPQLTASKFTPLPQPGSIGTGPFLPPAVMPPRPNTGHLTTPNLPTPISMIKPAATHAIGPPLPAHRPPQPTANGR